MSKTPFLLVGDGPAEPTGLGRLARDLAGLLVQSGLPIDLVQVGGAVPPIWKGWPHLPLDEGHRAGDWGAACVAEYWRELWGSQPGILFCVWDPGRLLDYAQLELPVQKWAYCAIDGSNIVGEIQGPAGAALKGFDRVLAYGRWASETLKRTSAVPVPYLPHGIETPTFATRATDEEQAWVASVLGPYVGKADVIGMVAANQPRKDFGVFFQTLAELRARGRHVYGWLHTDVPVKAWATAQLMSDLQLFKRMTVTIDTFTDRQLALLYQRCAVTMLASAGEGFGYPIVESLASGTPVVTGDCAGGAELVPKAEWRVPSRGTRLEGIYAHARPVWWVSDWANAVERALTWRTAVGRDVCAAYCQGAVAHLDWLSLWPRWRRWVEKGLQ